jgi:uncharacterized membrane protein
MRAWLRPLGFGLIVAALAHVGTILAMPNVIMSIAIKRIGETAGGMNTLFHAPKVSPQNQRIVRPSPDLAYSSCALDLSGGPVRIVMGKGSYYASVAIYDANTDNAFSLNDRRMGPDGARLLIAHKGQKATPAHNETLVTLSGTRGLALIRRLAPGEAAFDRADAERRADRCARATLP